MAGTAAAGTRRKLTPYLLSLPALAYLFVFFVQPLWVLLRTSLSTSAGSVFNPTLEFSWEFSNYSDAFNTYDEQIIRSFGYALAATLLALLLAYPLAYVLAFKAGKWKNVQLGLVILPFFITFIIRTLAWKTIFADKISLPAALPFGFSSPAEVLDVRLNEEILIEDIFTRLKDNLPPDIKVLDVKSVDERLPALQTTVLSAAYDVHLTEPVEGSELKRRVEKIINAESLIRERRGKTYDLPPLIEMLSIITQADGSSWLKMTLSAREGATGRPEEVLDVLGIAFEGTRIERTRLIF